MFVQERTTRPEQVLRNVAAVPWFSRERRGAGSRLLVVVVVAGRRGTVLWQRFANGDCRGAPLGSFGMSIALSMAVGLAGRPSPVLDLDLVTDMSQTSPLVLVQCSIPRRREKDGMFCRARPASSLHRSAVPSWASSGAAQGRDLVYSAKSGRALAGPPFLGYQAVPTAEGVPKRRIGD